MEDPNLNMNRKEEDTEPMMSPMYGEEMSEPNPDSIIYQFDIVEEIDFWSRRMREHMIFYTLFLSSPDASLYRDIAQQLLDEWSDFVTGKMDIDLFDLVNRTSEFKNQVLEAVRNQGVQGVWLGTTFESFIIHTLLELDYFSDKISGIQTTLEEELAFWNIDGADHAVLTSKMIDPSQDRKDIAAGLEEPLALQAYNTGIRIQNMVRDLKNATCSESNDYDDCISTFIEQSIDSNIQLNEFNQNIGELQIAPPGGYNLSSVIHPLMVTHILLEGERGSVVLQRIQNQLLEIQRIQQSNPSNIPMATPYEEMY